MSSYVASYMDMCEALYHDSALYIATCIVKNHLRLRIFCTSTLLCTNLLDSYVFKINVQCFNPVANI